MHEGESMLHSKTSNLTIEFVSILEAVFTVSPNKQYLGILIPTMPATTLPEWMPRS